MSDVPVGRTWPVVEPERVILRRLEELAQFRPPFRFDQPVHRTFSYTNSRLIWNLYGAKLV